MDATAITEKAAAGSKELRRYAVLGSTMGGGAVLAVAINKLSAEQIVYLTERMGGYLIICVVMGAIIYKVGNRMGSAIFQHANTNTQVAEKLGAVGASTRQVAETMQALVTKDDERTMVLEATVNHVAGESGTMSKLVQQMHLRQGEQDSKLDKIDDFMVTIKRDFMEPIKKRLDGEAKA